MKNIQPGITKFVTLFLALTVIVSCSSTPLTPSQTVQHFWTAVISGDVENAKAYSTSDSQPAMKDIKDEFNSSSVTFGKVNIQSNKAKIETTLTSNNKNPEQTVTANFETYLNKEEETWKVDYVSTKKSLEDAQQKKGLSKLADDLQKFGRDISGQMEGVIKHWEEVTPKIKEDLETLGNSVQKQLQESIDKHGPELQKKLQDFTDSLDDAVKDLQKGLPENKKSEEKEPEGRLI